MASKHQITAASLLLITTSIFSDVFADNWTNSNDIKTTFISYQGDTTRNNLTDVGINHQTHYLDKFSLLFGYNYTKLNTSQRANIDSSIAGNVDRNVQQRQLTVGANWFQYSDFINGRVGWHIKNYSLFTPASTIANVYNGGLSYLNYQNTLYLDALFTQSQYTNSQTSDNTVNQANLSIEFSPGLKSSWLSVQLVAIDNSDNFLFDSTLYSANVEWTQYLSRTGFPIPMSLVIGSQIGEQRYLVLHRLDSINNNPDAQYSSNWIYANWQINDNSQLSLSVVASEHQSDLQEKYDSLYSSILLNIKW